MDYPGANTKYRFLFQFRSTVRRSAKSGTFWLGSLGCCSGSGTGSPQASWTLSLSLFACLCATLARRSSRCFSLIAWTAKHSGGRCCWSCGRYLAAVSFGSYFERIFEFVSFGAFWSPVSIGTLEACEKCHISDRVGFLFELNAAFLLFVEEFQSSSLALFDFGHAKAAFISLSICLRWILSLSHTRWLLSLRFTPSYLFPILWIYHSRSFVILRRRC